MIAIVVAIETEANEYTLEIGSHCNDTLETHIVNGGSVNLDRNMIEIADNAQFEFFDKVKVYYQFPEGYDPTSYVDYLNYATKIVK